MQLRERKHQPLWFQSGDFSCEQALNFETGEQSERRENAWTLRPLSRAAVLECDFKKKSIDTWLWRHTATRLANRTMPSPYQGFLWRENEESMFWPFIDWLINEHLPKPFFKVIRKSLYCVYTLGTRYVTVYIATVLHFALSDAILKHGLGSGNKRVAAPELTKPGGNTTRCPLLGQNTRFRPCTRARGTVPEF